MRPGCGLLLCIYLWILECGNILGHVFCDREPSCCLTYQNPSEGNGAVGLR